MFNFIFSIRVCLAGVCGPCGMVGLVMGGIQSLSRSTFTKLIEVKEDDYASYYSFYDVLLKLATVFGTMSFGFIEQFSGGMRASILTLGLYFVIGIIIMSNVTISREIKSAPDILDF